MSLEVKGSMTTTVTVSASPDRSGNWVCDGVNDQVQINAAIDYCNSLTAGGMVKLLAGVYHLGASIVMKTNVGLKGDEKKTYLELDFDGVAIDTSNTVTNTDMYIGYLRIDGNRTVRAAGTGIRIYGGYRIVMENLYLHDFDDYGIYTGDSDGPVRTRGLFSNIRILNFGGTGWHMAYPQDTRFNNINVGTQLDANYCINIADGGSGCIFNNVHVWADGAGTTTGVYTGVNAFRIQFDNLYGGGANMDYLLHADGYSGVFTNIEGEDCTTAVLKLDGTKNTICGGSIYSANGTAIHVTGANCVCGDFQIYDPTSVAVNWDGNYGTCSNVNVYDSGGISFDIAGSYFTGSALNSYGSDSQAFHIVGNYVTIGNSGAYAPASHGFFLDGADYTQLTGCMAYGSTAQHGFYIYGSDWAVLSGCSARGNSAGNKRGFYLGGNSLNAVLSGLSAAGNGDYNLVIDAGSDNGIYDGLRFDNTAMTDNILNNGAGWTAGDTTLT